MDRREKYYVRNKKEQLKFDLSGAIRHRGYPVLHLPRGTAGLDADDCGNSLLSGVNLRPDQEGHYGRRSQRRHRSGDHSGRLAVFGDRPADFRYFGSGKGNPCASSRPEGKENLGCRVLGGNRRGRYHAGCQ